MAKVNAFGAFGAVVLENVQHGIDMHKDAVVTPSKSVPEYFSPNGSFDEMWEMYETATLRGHKIEAFVMGSNGGMFYIAA